MPIKEGGKPGFDDHDHKIDSHFFEDHRILVREQPYSVQGLGNMCILEFDIVNISAFLEFDTVIILAFL